MCFSGASLELCASWVDKCGRIRAAVSVLLLLLRGSLVYVVIVVKCRDLEDCRSRDRVFSQVHKGSVIPLSAAGVATPWSAAVSMSITTTFAGAIMVLVSSLFAIDCDFIVKYFACRFIAKSLALMEPGSLFLVRVLLCIGSIVVSKGCRGASGCDS